MKKKNLTPLPPLPGAGRGEELITGIARDGVTRNPCTHIRVQGLAFDYVESQPLKSIPPFPLREGGKGG